jgi:integrase/recombinase XerD
MHMTNPLSVEMSGPLSALAPGFLEELFRQGYRPETAAKQLQLMAHLSRWLAARELDGSDLSAAHVEQFLAERRKRHRHFVSSKAINPLLSYLGGLGVAPIVGPAAPRRPSELMIHRYSVYLLQRRGLSRSSVRNYANVARGLFADLERRQGELALDELDAAAVNAFVLREARRSSVGSTKRTVTRLRSLLRFLHVEGEIRHDLTGAVPRVASWRLASLVKALDADSVARLLRSCDLDDWAGRRDLAVLTLLSRLGLRAGEVAALRIGDVDWRAGEIMVRGKGSREEDLPLPVDVGEALADWLRDGRPHCEHQLVFTRVRAPHTGLSSTGIAGIVHAACKRAGLPEIGPHRLRHTAATEMLRAGASLSEVGQVLRHRDANTTAIYAKVDRRALAALIQPWPGDAA